MAIVKGIFSTMLKGRVGAVTYRNRNGQNIVSTRAASVKNPKTMSQQIQRMRMKTVMAAYSAFKEICDHSFEGISSGAKSQNHFMSVNLMRVMGARYYNLRQNPYPLINKLIISEGTLPNFNVSKISWDSDLTDLGGYVFDSDSFGRIKKAVTTEHPVTALTVQEVCDAMGINVGDQITLCLLYTITNGEKFTYNGMTQVQTDVTYARFIFSMDKANEPAFLEGENTTTFKLNPAVLTEESKNTVNVRYYQGIFSTNKSAFGLIAPFSYTDNDRKSQDAFFYEAGCSILSRKTNDKWLRSPSELWFEKGIYETKIGELAQTVKSYDPSENLYLNNAED